VAIATVTVALTVTVAASPQKPELQRTASRSKGSLARGASFTSRTDPGIGAVLAGPVAARSKGNDRRRLRFTKSRYCRQRRRRADRAPDIALRCAKQHLDPNSHKGRVCWQA